MSDMTLDWGPRLERALAVADATRDDLYELATALAQVVRRHRLGQAAHLAQAIARARARLAAESASSLLASLDEGALLDELEDLLADPDRAPEALLAVLIRLDEHAAVAQLLGESGRCAALVADAVALLRVYEDGARAVQALGAAYGRTLGVAAPEPAAALWAAVAEAEAEPTEWPGEPLAPRLAALIDAEAGLGRVITLPPRRLPVRRSDVQAWAVAASSGQRPLGDALLVESADQWQVVVWRRGPEPELGILADPEHRLPIAVEADGHPVALADDGLGGHSVILRPEVQRWDVVVGDMRLTLSWPDEA